MSIDKFTYSQLCIEFFTSERVYYVGIYEVKITTMCQLLHKFWRIVHICAMGRASTAGTCSAKASSPSLINEELYFVSLFC